jgi:hypothetical protein
MAKESKGKLWLRRSRTFCCSCCHALLDPLLLIYCATYIATLAVAITCLCVWLILFMNVAISIFVAAEAAYHSNDNYDLHTIVTLALFPTILLYWTCVMWCIVSHLIEWLILLFTTPRIRPTTRRTYSDDALANTDRAERTRPLDYLPAGTDVEVANTLEQSMLTDENGSPIPQSESKNDEVDRINHTYRKALDLENEAQQADAQFHTSRQVMTAASEGALKSALATKAKMKQANLSDQQRQLLPNDDEVEVLVTRTTKLVATTTELNSPKYLCNWSEYMLQSPFSTNWISFWLPYFDWVIAAAIIIEVVIIVYLNSVDLLNKFRATVLLTIFTGVLVMLWFILDAAEHCTRAFWFIWCYFALSAIISALCCLGHNDFPNKFFSTAVIVYVAVMFAISAVFAMHEVWVLPLHEFWAWASVACGAGVLYYIGMFCFWMGFATFAVAFFLYEFADDQQGVYFRTAYQLFWTVPAFLLVCKTLVVPRVPQSETGNISAYGPLTRGGWGYLHRLIIIGYIVLLIGVFGGGWAAGRSGVLSALVYCAGPLVLFAASLLVLSVMYGCGPDSLRQKGWSFPTVMKLLYPGHSPSGAELKEMVKRVHRETMISLWAWDLFRVYTVCVLVALIVIAVYSRMAPILLFLIMIVLQGYILIEYHFYSPVRSEITFGGVSFAVLNQPAKRLYKLVLLFLFFCIVVVMATAAWSLTTSYNQVEGHPMPRADDMSVADTVAHYGMCNQQTFHTLDVIDITYLTEMTYFVDPLDDTIDCGFDDPANLKPCLDNYFIPTYTKASTNNLPYDWQVLKVNAPNTAEESNEPTYYSIRSTSANLLVIGVRGSITGRDWLEDFHLYSETVLLQTFSLVVPLTYVWPPESTAAMVKAFSFSQKLLYTNEPGHIASEFYYEKVLNYAEDLQDQFPNYDLMLVGHSLGGAVAQVVAARMGVRGFGITPPGNVFAHKKFGVPGNFEPLTNTLVTVLRENDPYAKVDQHTGEIQEITCSASFLSAYCHSIHPIMCHFMAQCGELGRPTFTHWGGGNAYCGVV